MTYKGLALAATFAVATTGAEAADLLPPAPIVDPVDYVRVCDAFGVGFFYIPGTETCLRIAGRVRADYNLFLDLENNGFEVLANFGFDQRADDGYRFRSRAYIYLDSRTSTEFGLLRTFTELQFTSELGLGDGDTVFQNPGDGSALVSLNRAFIQFGGATFGRTQSFFDFLDASYGTSQFFNANFSDTTTNVAAYTATFGNGFSASVSVEDAAERNTRILDLNGFIPNTSPNFIDGYGGLRAPDVVGNLRVDAGWGSAQVMAAGHLVHSGLGTAASEYGFAVGGGINVNVPFGADTRFGIQGAYTQGALAYVSETPVGPGVGDAVYTNAQNLELVEAFSVSGGFSFSATPKVTIGAQAGFVYVDHAEFQLNNQQRSLDFVNYDADVFIGYAPVEGFTLGVGSQYKYVDTEQDGDGSALSTFFRAQRTF
ncbi:MAG: porin [Pseudomonadota bacterium]